MLRYMLDTNICIYASKSQSVQLRRKFNETAEAICISSIVLAELLFGAEKSAKRERNLSVVEQLAARVEVKSFDSRAALHYAQLRIALERRGSPVGSNDLLIGAHARSEGLTLVTNNVREFARMPGLNIENWVTAANS